MASYSNIFQPETSFRTQIVDLENEDKNSAWSSLFLTYLVDAQSGRNYS